jgi:hypothetical protein
MLTAYSGMLDLLAKIKQSKVVLKGDLEFVNNWEYFTKGSTPQSPTRFSLSDDE